MSHCKHSVKIVWQLKTLPKTYMGWTVYVHRWRRSENESFTHLGQSPFKNLPHLIFFTKMCEHVHYLQVFTHPCWKSVLMKVIPAFYSSSLEACVSPVWYLSRPASKIPLFQQSDRTWYDGRKHSVVLGSCVFHGQFLQSPRENTPLPAASLVEPVMVWLAAASIVVH